MNWKELVGSVAPVLGSALGGPFGGMAGKWLAGEMGVEEQALEDTVINSNPDIMYKIKELDNKFKLEMKRLGLEEKQLHADDRDSARKLATSTTIWPQVILSIIYDAAFCLICYSLFTQEISFSETQQTLVTYIMGILSAALIQVNNFWFGSSSGSKEKTAKLTIK